MMWKRIISGLSVVVMSSILCWPVQAHKLQDKNAQTSFAAGDSVLLMDLSPAEERSTQLLYDTVTDSTGNQHTGNVLFMDVDNESFVTYNLRGQYETFEAGIVCASGTAGDAYISVGVYADNVLIYNVDITASTPIQKISQNVTGVGRISIKTTYNSVGGDIYLVNGKFTKPEHPTVFPNRTALYDCTFADHGDIDTSESLYYDSALHVHEGAIELFANNWGESYVNIELNREYQFVVGKVIAIPETGNEYPVNVQIYLDDKLVFQVEGITHDSEPAPFEIYVKDGEILQILATTGIPNVEDAETAPGAVIAITDAYLRRHEHTPGEWTQESESTCREHGIRYMVCAECGERVVDEELPLKEHTPNGNVEVFKEPTCTEEGIKGQRCSVCGEEVETEPIAMISHTPGDDWVVTKKATCSEEGEEVRKCTVCGAVVQSQHTAKTEHNVSSGWKVIKEATCTEEGVQEKICVVCGEIVDTKKISMKDHEYSDWETKEGNIWSTPIVKERECKVCGFVDHKELNGTAWIRPTVIVLCALVVVVLIMCIPMKKRVPVKEFAPEMFSYSKSVFPEPERTNSSNAYPNQADWATSSENRTQVLPMGIDEAVNHDAEDWGQVRKMLDESDKISPDDEQK